MITRTTDVAVIGAGGAGLRTAIAVAESRPDLRVTLISKVYPMRSHTVAAEGGAAGVIREDDSLDKHFDDTVSGGDWLCDQDVVRYFVEHATEEMLQLEHWGCPWSRQDDGHVNVRRFGGMKVPRTWFAADKTGFHMLHTLFQTSLKYPTIERLDEHFCLELVQGDGRIQGVLAYDVREGLPIFVQAGAVVIATGGAGRVYRYNTNGSIVTGDGMALAYRAGVPLRDMEFVQYHPTGLPGSGILITEGCRGEGGVLVNSEGRRYLQDYGLGPETPIGHPENKHMELGPRDRLSQAFWHEQRAGRTIATPGGDAVHLDLRHLGREHLHERLPFICELAQAYVGVDPATSPIPVRPTAHYTMGGIETDGSGATRLPGLFAVGECASNGLHGANRLGSNSLAELVVFGKVTGEAAATFAGAHRPDAGAGLRQHADAVFGRHAALLEGHGDEPPAAIRTELGNAMEDGVGIFRTGDGITATTEKIAELKDRYRRVRVADSCPVFNTDWLTTIELGYLLDVAETMAFSALGRTESRGSHQRLDGYTERNDADFLTHTLAFHTSSGEPSLDYSPVTITTSPPALRAYGAAGDRDSAGSTP